MFDTLEWYDYFGNLIQVIPYTAVMIYLAGSKLFPVFKSIRYWVSISIFTFIIACIQQFDESFIWIGLVADFVLYALVVRINSRSSFKESILSSVIGYSVVTVIETIFLIVIMLMGMDVAMEGPGNIQTFVALGLIGPASYIVMKYTPIAKLKKKLEPSGYIITMSMVIAVFAVTMTMLIVNEYTFMSHISNEVIVIMSLIMIVILILEEMSERRRREQLHYYETYLPIVQEMVNSVQVSQHSYNNQIMSIMGIIEQDCSKEQMKSALYELTGCAPMKAKADYQFLHLDNKLLAGLLYQKTINAEKEGYSFDYTIRQYSFDSRLSNFDIIDVTGILIDNAIEHCEEDYKKVYITIGESSNSKDSRYYIRVENAGPEATSEFIHDMFKKGRTTKADKEGHGLGMYILRTRVNKVRGKIVINNVERDGVRMLSIEVEV